MTIRDDGGGLFHRRFQIGIGLVGDQHFAGLKLFEVRGGRNHAHQAGGDLLPHAAAAYEHGPFLAQVVRVHRLGDSLRLHRLRPSLHDE